MSYSIFKDTIVDMPFTKIEQQLEKGACVLFPLSVVEEHGAHLCTGTDIYLTQNVCEKIKRNLNAKGKNTLIAPPFYWGINSVTNGFTGSFSISPSLVKAILLEILDNLQKWGAKKVFLLSFHGDWQHIQLISSIAETATHDKGLETYFINSSDVCTQFRLPTKEEYILPVSLPTTTTRRDYLDIHAGAEETNWLLLNYPNLVDVDTALTLPATSIDMPGLKKWLQGGEHTKEVTPQGYLGNPADIDREHIKKYEEEIVSAFAKTIAEKIA